MLHYVNLETTEFDQEDDGCSEEDATFDLQCGESLAVAANHIGEDIYRVKKILQRSLTALSRIRWRA
jgi:hypothetical protein